MCAGLLLLPPPVAMAKLFGVVTANSLTWPQKRGFRKSQRNQGTLLNNWNHFNWPF